MFRFLYKKDYAYFKKQFEIYFNNTPGFKKTINKVSYEKEQGEFKKIEGNILNVLYEKEEYDQDLNNNIERINTFCTLSLLTMDIFAKKKKKWKSLTLPTWSILPTNY